MIIVEMIVDGGFFVYVKTFCSVEVRAFLVEVYHLHDVLNGAKECWWSFRCLAKLEEGELLRKDRLCSWYLEVKSLPVCPMCTFPQSGQVSLYTPDCVSGSR